MQTQVVTLDVLKPIGTTVDLSDSFNARVGDKMTPFQLFITEGGVAKDLKGMHPELEAEVGNGALRNGVAVMAAGAKGVHWVGSTNNVTGYNQLTLAFPAEVFPQSGFCYGHLILANDAGVRETSVDIWFQVLDGTPLMGLVADHYDSELQLELAKAKNANNQFSQEMRNTYNQQVTDAQNAMAIASAKLKGLAATAGSIDAKIKSGDIVTLDQYSAGIKKASATVETKLAQIQQVPNYIPDLATLQKEYPKGAAGLYVTSDNHGHIWYKDAWLDTGLYNATALPNNIKEASPNYYLQIPLTLDEQGAYYDAQLKKNLLDGAKTYQPIYVRPHGQYRVVTKLGGYAALVLQDDNGATKAITVNADGSDIYDIFTENYTKLYICTIDGSPITGYARAYGIANQFENTKMYCQNYLSYKVADNKLEKVKQSDYAYAITEMFYPSELADIQVASPGLSFASLVFCDDDGQIVEYKTKERPLKFTQEDLQSDKEFTYVAFCGYNPQLSIKPDTPHHGFPNLTPRQATVILEFDNEEDDFYKSRFELLKKYGFPFSFAISSSFRQNNGFKNAANKQTYYDMINFGCDPMIYGGIGANPDPATATERDWHDYVDTWLDYCNDHGIYTPIYATSHNDLPQNLINVLKQRGFSYARTIPYWTDSRSSIELDDFRMPTLALDNGENTLDKLKVAIESAINNCETVSVLSHLIGGPHDYQVSEEVYTQFLDWLTQKVKAGQIKVTTYSGLLAGTEAMQKIIDKRQAYILHQSSDTIFRK